MSSSPRHNYPPIKLPHPFLTVYRVHTSLSTTPATLFLTLESQPSNGVSPPQPLHLAAPLTWTGLSVPPSDQSPPLPNNTPWGRARRSPHTTLSWPNDSPPPLGPVWNVVHAIFLAHPARETFRLTLLGEGKTVLRDAILATGLGVAHPKRPVFNPPGAPAPSQTEEETNEGEEVLILRAAFWQGAASPTGSRPIWVVGDGTSSAHLQPVVSSKSGQSIAEGYPPMPEIFQVTNRFPAEPVYTRHPVRRPKPRPGSLVYSRYVPEIDSHFSLEVVDWQREEHLKLFNTWQNDERVAAGWNERGTLEEHRGYLRRLWEDPHVICLFGRFGESRFAYFEIYWAKVCLSFFFFFLLSLSFYPCVCDNEILVVNDDVQKGGPLRRALRRAQLRPR